MTRLDGIAGGLLSAAPKRRGPCLSRVVDAFLAAVQEGDAILLDIENRRIELGIPAAELEERLRAWKPRAPKYTSGVFQKYIRLVGSAAQGAVTG